MDSTHVPGMARTSAVKKKLLYILNESTGFVSHRLQIALAARATGYDVHIATGDSIPHNTILKEGFTYHHLPISRSGRNIFSELKTLFAMAHLMKKLKPSLVHLVTIKPVIYGSIAANFSRVPAVVAAVSGLGYAFIEQNTEARFLRRIISTLYRIAFRHPNLKIIFQNIDDKNKLLQLRALKENQSIIIHGSGVDLNRYTPSAERCITEQNPTIIVMAARLLRDKGVIEYVNAAKLLRTQGIHARFLLAGNPDPGNPSSITEEQLHHWTKAGDIEYIGYCQNIPELFAQVHIVVLPSYREGLPRVLAEAASCGRAVITTDVPGCRAAIRSGKTGLLVKVCDHVSLAEAIRQLVINPELRQSMGKAGRQLAEETFDIEGNVVEHMKIYGEVDE